MYLKILIIMINNYLILKMLIKNIKVVKSIPLVIIIKSIIYKIKFVILKKIKKKFNNNSKVKKINSKKNKIFLKRFKMIINGKSL
jgi:hypothetical protein